MRCPVVVGRELELAMLAAMVDSAAHGSGSCLVVAGEAGVGKTRLVTEVVARAGRSGSATLVGRATPTDRTSPLRPLAEALLGGLRDREPPKDAALRPYRPALGMLVPHWADQDRTVRAVPPAPVVLAEAVLRALRWLAGSAAAVLVIEDLHWIDQETQAVLEYLADHVAEVPVVVVLTVRSDEPTSTAVEAAFGRAGHVRLTRLAGPGVAAMAAACLGVPEAPPELLDTLHRAGGLPLVVEDLVAMDGAHGPLRYAEIVGRRLADIDPAGRQVVNVAAVLGNEVDVALIAAVGELSDAELAGALRTAAASGILDRGDGSAVVFRHALTREFVLAELAKDERAGISLAAAVALDSAPEEQQAISGRLGELWAQGGDPRRAVQAWCRAARGARTAGATGTAEALLRRAMEVAPLDLAGSVRLELLELLELSGRVEELVVLGNQLLDELAHDRDLTAAVHLLLAQAAVGTGTPQDAGPHLDAVTRLGELGPRRAAQLRIVQARVVMSSGAPDRLTSTGHLAGQAIAFAEQSGDPELSCAALELAATAVRIRDLTAAAEMLYRELAVAERAGLVLWRLRALNELGIVESLRDARPDRLERALALALRIGAVDTAASVAINLAAVYSMTGGTDAALAAASRAQQLAAPLGATAAVAAATGIEAVTHGFTGRRAEMERLARRALELSPDDADLAAFVWAAGRGLTALIYEERDDAIAAFRLARKLATPIRTLDAAIGPLLLVQAVQGLDVRADVEAEQARSTAGARWSAAWLGYAHSVAQACAGEPDGALAAFDAAERAADRYPLFRGIALRLVAESALRHPFGEPVRWLREAEAEFVGRGLHRIAAACRGLLAQAGAPATRRRGQDAALPPELLRLGVSAREAEVLELIGERLSNKDIAGRLYLSPRTVEKHVASLLFKTGADGRAALTWLARNR